MGIKMLTYAYVVILMDPVNYNYIPLTEGFLPRGSIYNEPISMFLLSGILTLRANRLACIVAHENNSYTCYGDICGSICHLFARVRTV